MEKSSEGNTQTDGGVMVMCEIVCENSLHNSPECQRYYWLTEFWLSLSLNSKSVWSFYCCGLKYTLLPLLQEHNTCEAICIVDLFFANISTCSPLTVPISAMIFFSASLTLKPIFATAELSYARWLSSFNLCQSCCSTARLASAAPYSGENSPWYWDTVVPTSFYIKHTIEPLGYFKASPTFCVLTPRLCSQTCSILVW